jgi:DNA-binding FrmR family transcriptional regulator
MKTAEQRINNIVGQLNGVKKMLVDKERDCFSVIMQLKASKSALDSLMGEIINVEFDHCLRAGQPNKRKEIEKIFKEIIKNN